MSKLLWLRVALVLGALGVLGFLVAVSGVIPIKASSGHTALTRWFLSMSMRRSVETHTLTLQPPSDLSDASLVLKGAGHYESGCKPCHGAPGEPRSAVARAMTPQPPWLPEVVPEWSEDDLFYIVKHGVKFTGMPAWPALEREDEVWAMVAFLRRLPGMEPDEYRQLALGDAAPLATSLDLQLLGDAPLPVRENCARCHGVEGEGRGTGAFPKLAGQSAVYLAEALEAFARGERLSGIMQPVAVALEADAIEELARYYATRAPTAALGEPSVPARSERIERGRRIAHGQRAAAGEREGRVRAGGRPEASGSGNERQPLPERPRPACVHCHGPSPFPRNPHYPILAGQYEEYLALQLRLFKAGRRGGSDYAHIMHEIVTRLTAEEIDAVAAYYAALEAR